jgi:hypothetical protein
MIFDAHTLRLVEEVAEVPGNISAKEGNVCLARMICSVAHPMRSVSLISVSSTEGASIGSLWYERKTNNIKEYILKRKRLNGWHLDNYSNEQT